MVISSIDLKNGHVVQLKNGKELVLQRDDADALIAQFDMFGEVAVIDLDAALGNIDAKGNTVNTHLLKSLLHMAKLQICLMQALKHQEYEKAFFPLLVYNHIS